MSKRLVVLAHDFDLYGFDVSPGDSDCYNGVFWYCLSHTCRDPDQNVDGFALGHGTQHDFWLYRCEAYDVYDGIDISSRDTLIERCSAHHRASKRAAALARSRSRETSGPFAASTAPNCHQFGYARGHA